VIAGFEPLDVLFAVVTILRQTKEGRGELENAYRRVVKTKGNPNALRMMDKVFSAEDAPWRGIGTIPRSGLRLKPEFEGHDASLRLEGEAEEDYSMPAGCRCGEVLRAVIYPWECPAFNRDCDPEHPIGPCMVSHEGSCFIAAKYGVEES
jgi:hydrogenase expression/formation protein HypD